jgi:ABC-type phosphate transport system auxiliary subunit
MASWRVSGTPITELDAGVVVVAVVVVIGVVGGLVLAIEEWAKGEAPKNGP